MKDLWLLLIPLAENNYSKNLYSYTFLLSITLLLSLTHLNASAETVYDNGYKARILCFPSLPSSFREDRGAFECGKPNKLKSYYRVHYAYPFIIKKIEKYTTEKKSPPRLIQRLIYTPSQHLSREESWNGEDTPDGTWYFWSAEIRDDPLLPLPEKEIPGRPKVGGFVPRRPDVYDRFGWGYTFSKKPLQDNSISERFRINGSVSAYVDELERQGSFIPGTSKAYRSLYESFPEYLKMIEEKEQDKSLPPGSLKDVLDRTTIPTSWYKMAQLSRTVNYARDHCAQEDMPGKKARYIRRYRYAPNQSLFAITEYYLPPKAYEEGVPHAAASIGPMDRHGREIYFSETGNPFLYRQWEHSCKEGQSPRLKGLERIASQSPSPPYTISPPQPRQSVVSDESGPIQMEDLDKDGNYLLRLQTKHPGNEKGERTKMFVKGRLRLAKETIGETKNPHGTWTNYDEKGRIIETQSFSRGQLAGHSVLYTWIKDKQRPQIIRNFSPPGSLKTLQLNFFDDNGIRTKEERYRSENPPVPHGIWWYYDSKGRPKRRESYRDGVPDGVWNLYDERDGSLFIVWQETWKKGELLASDSRQSLNF